MGDQPRYRTLVERPEYTAAFDIIAAKYPAHVIDPILSGLLWGITTNPQVGIPGDAERHSGVKPNSVPG